MLPLNELRMFTAFGFANICPPLKLGVSLHFNNKSQECGVWHIISTYQSLKLAINSESNFQHYGSVRLFSGTVIVISIHVHVCKRDDRLQAYYHTVWGWSKQLRIQRTAFFLIQKSCILKTINVKQSGMQLWVCIWMTQLPANPLLQPQLKQQERSFKMKKVLFLLSISALWEPL